MPAMSTEAHHAEFGTFGLTAEEAKALLDAPRPETRRPAWIAKVSIAPGRPRAHARALSRQGRYQPRGARA
jgi:hypothetical protein